MLAGLKFESLVDWLVGGVHTLSACVRRKVRFHMMRTILTEVPLAMWQELVLGDGKQNQVIFQHRRTLDGRRLATSKMSNDWPVKLPLYPDASIYYAKIRVHTPVYLTYLRSLK